MTTDIARRAMLQNFETIRLPLVRRNIHLIVELSIGVGMTRRFDRILRQVRQAAPEVFEDQLNGGGNTDEKHDDDGGYDEGEGHAALVFGLTNRTVWKLNDLFAAAGASRCLGTDTSELSHAEAWSTPRVSRCMREHRGRHGRASSRPKGRGLA